MYSVYVDLEATGEWRNLYYQGDPDYVAHDIECVTAKGDAGSLKLTIPKKNPLWGQIATRKSILRFQVDKEVIGYFEVRERCHDMRWSEQIYAVGELAWLNDSIQPQGEFHDISAYAFLRNLLMVHNAQCYDHKFSIGTVNVTDSNDSLYRYTNRETTLADIREKLVDRLGGQIRLRHVGNTRYLDYLTDETYGNESTQRIYFGENMLDYSDTLSADGICSEVIPLGARLENDSADNSTIGNLEKRVTVESVNGGSDTVCDAGLTNRFGHVRKVMTWDDVTEPANLMTKALAWLNDEQYERMHLVVKAVDLSISDAQFGALRCGDSVVVVAPSYGLNKRFPITKRTFHPDHPDNDVIEMGSDTASSYVAWNDGVAQATSSKLIDFSKQHVSYLTDAVKNVTAMMTGSRGGYKLSEYDDEGRWLADYYMDSMTKETAQVVHKVSLDGDAYSTSGVNGPYETAVMANGTILGKYIEAHSIGAEQISVAYTDDLVTQFTVADQKIVASVEETYATKNELRIGLDGITLSATNAGLGSKATIRLQANGVNHDTTIDLTKVRRAFANDASAITISAGTVSFTSNTFAVNSDNFIVTRNGIMKCYSAELYNAKIHSESYEGNEIQISDGQIVFKPDGAKQSVTLTARYTGGIVTTEGSDDDCEVFFGYSNGAQIYLKPSSIRFYANGKRTNATYLELKNDGLYWETSNSSARIYP